MSAITLDSGGVAIVFSEQAEIRDIIATEAITKGQPVYVTTAGKAGVADANGSGKQQFRGIALKAVAAGGVCPVLRKGYLRGFDLSGLNYDAPVYLSDTAGSLDTAAGTMTVVCGRVSQLADPDLTKILYVEARDTHIWA